MVKINNIKRATACSPICPFCHDRVALSESLVQCGDCNARHHSECWLEIGKCSTCSGNKAMVRKSDVQAHRAQQIDPAIVPQIKQQSAFAENQIQSNDIQIDPLFGLFGSLAIAGVFLYLTLTADEHRLNLLQHTLPLSLALLMPIIMFFCSRKS